jgi:hypothetical protein
MIIVILNSRGLRLESHTISDVTTYGTDEANSLRFLPSRFYVANAHHALPTLSHYHLAEAQHELELRFPSIVGIMYSHEMLAVIRACQLYDSERGCWNDYDRHPTSAMHHASGGT